MWNLDGPNMGGSIRHLIHTLGFYGGRIAMASAWQLASEGLSNILLTRSLRT